LTFPRGFRLEVIPPIAHLNDPMNANVSCHCVMPPTPTREPESWKALTLQKIDT